MGNVRNRPFEKVAAPSETPKGLLRATGIELAAVADDGSNAAGNGINSSEWLRAGKQRRCQNLPDTKDVLNFWRHPKKENAEPPFEGSALCVGSGQCSAPTRVLTE